MHPEKHLLIPVLFIALFLCRCGTAAPPRENKGNGPAPSAPAGMPPNPWRLPSARVPLLPGAPRLDGKLDDPFWKNAAVLGGFQPMVGGYGAVRPRTEVRIATTHDTLFLAIRCRERDMKGLKAPRRAHDSGGTWDDDTVEIFVSTCEDPALPYHQIAINAAGAVDDYYARSFIWDAAHLKAVTGREKEAWTLEVAIPFDDLNHPLGKRPVWRFNVVRTRTMHKGDRGTAGVRKIDATGKEYYEETAWSPTECGNNHVPFRFGYLYLEALASPPDGEQSRE